MDDGTTRPSDIYRGVGGSVWQLAEGNLMHIVEMQMRPKMQEYLGNGKVVKEKWTYEEFKKDLDSVIRNVIDQLDIEA